MENKTVKYEDCFVAFLDILGFKNKVLDSKNNADTLKKIVQSLKIVNAIPSGGKDVISDSKIQQTIQIQSRSFSDSMVFFLKENKENSNNIAQLFFVIRYLQDQLWQNGICLRGGITRGKMYWADQKDNITVGLGLIEACKLESKLAIYPRIVVSDKLYKYVKKKSIPSDIFGTSEGTDLTEFISQDKDGIHFLDLLNPGITRATDEKLEKNENKGTFSIIWKESSVSKHSDILAKVDSMIRDNIVAEDDKIGLKYEWLKSYRNLIR